jgi:hypothetical protein
MSGFHAIQLDDIVDENEIDEVLVTEFLPASDSEIAEEQLKVEKKVY